MTETIILEQKPVQTGAATGTLLSKRQRLYIFPTRHGLIYACMLAVMLLGAVNYTNNMAYMLTFMLASLFMVCMLHTYRNLRGLVVSLSEAKPVFAGDSARFPIVFDNRDGRQRSNICVDVRPARGKYINSVSRLRIGAAQMHRDFLSVPTTTRGYQRIGRLKIHASFPLGLFRSWSYLDSNSKCIVYPKPLGNPGLPYMVEDTARDQAGQSAGTDDFTGFSQYRPGDSIRNIDWKAYARERGLLVKKFSGSGARKLVLNWNQTAQIADTEARLSQLALWVLRADQLGLQYGIVLPGVQLETGQGEAHRHLCLRELAVYGKDPDR